MYLRESISEVMDNFINEGPIAVGASMRGRFNIASTGRNLSPLRYTVPGPDKFWGPRSDNSSDKWPILGTCPDMLSGQRQEIF